MCFPILSGRMSAAPGRLLCPGLFRWTQPERDMRGLHGLLYYGQQVLTQLLQVDFLAQGRAESWHRLGGVILSTIEAPVNNPLDAPTERLEQKVDSQRGEDDGHAAALVDDAT